MRSLPNASEPMNEAIPQKVRVPWYAWFDELWRKLRPIWSLTEGDVLVITNGGIGGRTIVDGEPFPEAPQDGAIYGRKNAAWTQVIAGGTTSPASPDTSIQFNNAGAFGGSANLTYDSANNVIFFGNADAGTLQPVTQATGTGKDLTIRSGAATASGGPVAGALNLLGGLSTTGQGGTINITAGATSAAAAGGDVNVTGGATSGTATTAGEVAITGGASTVNDGGDVSLTGGATSNIGFAGGEVDVRGGESANTGGAVNVFGGRSLGNNGANLNIGGGAGTSGTTNGIDAGIVNIVTRVVTAASAAARAGVSVPHGAAPTSPLDGDFWSTTAGFYVQVNGTTVGPLIGASGTGASQCPYFIAAGDSFLVAQYKQVPFVLPIEVDGDLEIDGYLIEVN